MTQTLTFNDWQHHLKKQGSCSTVQPFRTYSEGLSRAKKYQRNAMSDFAISLVALVVTEVIIIKNEVK